MSRRGFTLIELLVAIAIIAILIALLLPAVMGARDAARRTQCRSNLHQVGIALHTYHDAHGLLPPGYVYWRTGTGPAYAYHMQATSWMTLLLPQLDEQSLYNAYNSDLGAYTLSNVPVAANTTVASSMLLQYCCPNDSEPDVVDDRFRESTYAGNMGPAATFANPAYMMRRYRGQVGPLFSCSSIRMRDIRDGRSNTMLVGETASLAAPASDVKAVPRAAWALGRDEYGLRWTAVGLNTVCASDPSRPGYVEGCQFQFRSTHQGGGFFLMCDGRVRFIDDTIDASVYRALSTIANDEVVSGDAF